MNTAGSVVTIGEPGTGRPRRRRSFSASAAASCCCRDAMRSRCCCRCRAALSRFRSMRARLRASRSSMVELLRFWPIFVCWSRPVRGWCARIDILRPFPRAERGEELGVTPAWVRPVNFLPRPFCWAVSLVGALCAAAAGVLRRCRAGGGRSARPNSAFPEFRVDLHGGASGDGAFGADGVERFGRGLEASATFSAWLAGAALHCKAVELAQRC